MASKKTAAAGNATAITAMAGGRKAKAAWLAADGASDRTDGTAVGTNHG